jgi:hypothetical protein
MELPKQTHKIYNHLLKGNFLSDNTTDPQLRELYEVTQRYLESLKEYFRHIGLLLVEGDGYYHFARQESRSGLESKIDQAYKWIDLLDFFKTFNPEFTAGFHFSISEIAEEVKVNGGLKEKLSEAQSYTRITSGKAVEQIRALVKLLEEASFVTLENENEESYKVLSAFHYLEELIKRIEITETVESHEASE